MLCVKGPDSFFSCGYPGGPPLVVKKPILYLLGCLCPVGWTSIDHKYMGLFMESQVYFMD